MKIAIGSDHAGFELKRELIKELEANSITVIDEGTYTLDSCDYPDFASKVVKELRNSDIQFGVLICYTGVGISIAANKHKGIRAALVTDTETAHLAREHNNANIVCMGARTMTKELALKIVMEFIHTPFSNGERHQRRINKITALEEKE